MSEPGSGHELVEHTGDMAIEVRAPTLDALYDEGARALFDVILDVTTVEPREEVGVEVDGAADEADLFVRFLSELLFLHDARDWLFGGFRTRERTARSIAGTAVGERFDPRRHHVLRQVKAVTYHQARVESRDLGWSARVVLDL